MIFGNVAASPRIVLWFALTQPQGLLFLDYRLGTLVIAAFQLVQLLISALDTRLQLLDLVFRRRQKISQLSDFFIFLIHNWI